MIEQDDMRTLDIGITMAVSTLVQALGMLAENQLRAANGEAPAYGREQFEDLIRDNDCHWNGVLGRWQR